MVKIERILCPVDFSEFSVNAYDYAQSLARHYKATLYLQHVIDSLTPYYPYYAFPNSYNEICEKLRADALQQLQDFAKQHNGRGVQPELVVQDGSVPDSILGLAEAKAVNLIVMGTHGLGGIDLLTLGSVTDKVLRKAKCPVLAVRKPAPHSGGQTGSTDPIQLHRIVCCTDFSESSAPAWQHAVSLAAEYGAELTLLCVLEDITNSSDIEKETNKALGQLEKQISSCTEGTVKATPIVCIGKAYQQIVEFAMESQTDVIVMGVLGRHAREPVFGSTTYRVVQLGPCPVLAVHA